MKRMKTFLFSGLLLLGLTFFSASINLSGALPAEAAIRQRINAPFFPGIIYEDQGAISWFGQVNPTTNSTDIRLGYNPTGVKVTLHVIDRRVWYDTNAKPADLTKWDGVTLYLNTAGPTGGAPSTTSYRFDSQITWFENPNNYASAARGTGTAWQVTPLAFTTNAAWRGDLPNTNIDDKGYYIQYEIPFSSLGLSQAPPAGTVWGLALVVHDRDDAAGTPIPDQTWPAGINYQSPATWGELHFGMPTYTPPAASPGGTVTIYNGLNGQVVTDAHVGGHTICGDGLDHWSEWGYKNYAGYDQINIQNQWDISDYPCFSRYYVTFPLTTVPAGKTILSASLIMRTFGNAGYAGLPKDSLIQVLIVNQDWNENTINWNNGPPPMENVANTWVAPANEVGKGTLTYSWDVSYALAKAYAAGQPLRLAVYSPDGNYHSGKYFWAAETGSVGPTLQVTWGDSNFDLSTTPRTRIVTSGTSSQFTVNVKHSPSFTENVTLSASAPGGSPLGITLNPTVIPPGGGPATLTLQDQRAPSNRTARWFQVKVTGTAGAIVKEQTVNMLVNPTQVFLPMIRR